MRMSAGIMLLLISTQREGMLIPMPSSYHVEAFSLRAVILNVKNKNLNPKVKIKISSEKINNSTQKAKKKKNKPKTSKFLSEKGNKNASECFISNIFIKTVIPKSSQ